MKRTLSVLFSAAVALVSLLGTAAAEPGVSSGPDVQVGSPATPGREVSPLALSCPAGDLCVWPVSDGSRNRCSWTNSDNDWQVSPVTCSWSSSSPVMAVYNHGTSTSYSGVCLYPGANYSGVPGGAYLISQGDAYSGVPGVKIRSHRWVTGDSCF
ncbi:peptidase inhibitor family I36 protein [Actinophytocola oryzae]|uniref:Peptidase inhibitor family I36 n=1 Tax=Actinophytocola oryzae TaxID=502181 RepID=A0A4R7W153_9PSEU|nr:peptidase inhibitor family I36 protein [Actinophytocola oryzae]TDV56142.1 peptidase inhibitor family I36 [Actinophytocola oryzae]